MPNTSVTGSDSLAVVVTPWYPTEENPVWGTFVKDAVTALTRHHRGRLQVVHVNGNPLSETERAAGRAAAGSWRVDERRPEGDVRVIRVPFDPQTSRAKAIELHRAALKMHAADILSQAAVVSAHVGGPTAAALAPILHRDTRFIVTEHATYVRGLFNDTAAAVQYRQAVARATAVLCVSDTTAHTLRSLCPADADRVHTVPNPVDVQALPVRQSPSHRRDRWLFVGNLVERKGVRQLLAAFAEEVAQADGQRPGLHLTLVGDGPLRAELEAQAARSAPGRVTFAGSVPPADVADYYLYHDLLVHLADHETFGLTLVEAAATGLPVVVTRCGGPEETMVMPEGFGLCAFVPRQPSTQQVREAVLELSTGTTIDDLRLVRHALQQFYGSDRAADLQSHYVLGVPPTEPLATPVDLTVVAAYEGLAGWGRLQHGLRRCADLGIRVKAVDLQGQVASAPAGVELLSPAEPDSDTLFRRTGLLVDRLPRAVLSQAARVLPRLPERTARRGLRAVVTAERLHRRVSRATRTRLYDRVWPLVRGQVVARRVEAMPQFADLGSPDVIVHHGRQTELAYRLATRHPDAVVHQGNFTSADIARWWLHVYGPGGSRAHAQLGDTGHAAELHR